MSRDDHTQFGVVIVEPDQAVVGRRITAAHMPQLSHLPILIEQNLMVGLIVPMAIGLSIGS